MTKKVEYTEIEKWDPRHYCVCFNGQYLKENIDIGTGFSVLTSQLREFDNWDLRFDNNILYVRFCNKDEALRFYLKMS